MAEFRLEDLEAIIAARAGDMASTSYTRTLLDGGAPLAAKKFGEEAVELIIAGLRGKRADTVNEAADVLYHLLVLLRCEGIALRDVVADLGRRTGQSGHAEKAARNAPAAAPAR